MISCKKLSGILLSYSVYEIYCPQKNCNNDINKFKISNKHTLHLHHWIIHLILYFIYIRFIKNPSEFIEGLLLGGFIHGVVEYPDFSKFFLKTS